ncbi:hypothetical protein NMY22_g17929 [Coprinellus aureogranulatus]|nr:hypothetical protein NMY22_g17929 [Coprinellus aureogranulatus]
MTPKTQPHCKKIMEAPFFDNPVMTETSQGKVVRAPPEEQPRVVVHRMYWQGEKKSVDVACGVYSVVDADFGFTQSPNVVADSEAGTPILPMRPGTQSENPTPINNLKSLTLASHVELDGLFMQLKFHDLIALSLRLHGTGPSTTFENLVSSAFPPVLNGDTQEIRTRTFNLQCQLMTIVEQKQELDRLLKQKKVQSEYAQIE